MQGPVGSVEGRRPCYEGKIREEGIVYCVVAEKKGSQKWR